MLSKIRSITSQVWIALFCLAIVVARFVWPSLQYDADSRDLILIAMLCILVPDLVGIIARVKKLKIGDSEFELVEAINQLATQTQAAEERVDSDEGADPFHRIGLQDSAAVERYIRDPRGGLIAVAVDIENRVNELLNRFDISPTSRGYASPVRGVDYLAKRGVIVQEIPSLMKDFWAVRNRVVHGTQADMTPGDIYRLVDLGVRILDLLALTRTPRNQ